MYSRWPGQSGTATDVRARGATVYTPSRTSKAARLEPFILTYSIAVLYMEARAALPTVPRTIQGSQFLTV